MIDMIYRVYIVTDDWYDIWYMYTMMIDMILVYIDDWCDNIGHSALSTYKWRKPMAWCAVWWDKLPTVQQHHRTSPGHRSGRTDRGCTNSTDMICKSCLSHVAVCLNVILIMMICIELKKNGVYHLCCIKEKKYSKFSDAVALSSQWMWTMVPMLKH